MKNERIRKLARQHDLKLWEIADAIGISQSTFTIWLRHELTADKEARVEAAIYSLAGVEGNKNDA